MATISEYMNQIQKKARPAYTLTYTSNHGFSKIGGTPDLPSDFSWPECNGVPLPFIAQIDLEEIMKNKPLKLLPTSGKLYFFYDDEIFATCPSLEQISPWRIFYFEKDKKVFSTQAPNNVSVAYREKFMSGTSIQSLPSLERVVTELLNFDEEDMDLLYDTLCDSIETYYNNEPFHQLGGFPIPVNTDTMEEECQKIYEKAKKDQKKSSQGKEENKNEWILLLQIDSDDETEMMWGDEGLIYFWIKKEDLAKKDFSNVCMLIDYS